MAPLAAKPYVGITVTSPPLFLEESSSLAQPTSSVIQPSKWMQSLGSLSAVQAMTFERQMDPPPPVIPSGRSPNVSPNVKYVLSATLNMCPRSVPATIWVDVSFAAPGPVSWQTWLMSVTSLSANGAEAGFTGGEPSGVLHAATPMSTS